MKILFKYATRSRPELFKRGIASIVNNCVSENYQILVSYDSDDITMDGIEKLYEGNSKIVFCKGTSTSKINAINRDMSVITDWDILVNMSDDMLFICEGFDSIIRNSFDNLDQCLHFPDGNTTTLITMSILGRKFFDRFGYIYHPDYISLFSDNEQTEVAMTLGCYKYVNQLIFLHLHPAYRKAESDKQYIQTESYWSVDQATFARRKSNNFDL
jgi:hypothetical protein